MLQSAQYKNKYFQGENEKKISEGKYKKGKTKKLRCK